MTGKVAGTSMWAKVGRCFGKFVTKFTESRAWKAVARSGLIRYCKKYGPKILASTTKWAGKLSNVAGWVMLVSDIKDAAELTWCVTAAFEHKADPAKMPNFCNGAVTKAIIKYSMNVAGEEAVDSAGLTGEEEVEQDNVVTTDSAWSINDEKNPEAVMENSRDDVEVYDWENEGEEHQR